MRWVGAWYLFGGIVSFAIGAIQLSGSYTAGTVFLLWAIAAVAAGTGVALLLRRRGAIAIGLLVGIAGALVGIWMLVVFVPMLDVISTGWLTMAPVFAWIAAFAACVRVLAREARLPAT